MAYLLDQSELLAQFERAYLQNFVPAYKLLIQDLQALKKIAPVQGRASSLPKGAQFYQHALKTYTTTDSSAEEIHQIGLKEVQRIHREMKTILTQVHYKKSLKDFFKLIQSEKFTYPSTQKGRDDYLRHTNEIISKMKKSLPKMFRRLPKADIVVKAVEAYREKSAGLAFYYPPTLDGSRPGIYYVNLHDMSAVNKTEMEALAYHEAVPGHHMQIAIAQELEHVPLFRKLTHYTAFSEGWALYAEYLPKEYGFYTDPYSDFGRLSMELWRAARLVVDTGLHHKGWSQEKAIDWLNENTPSPAGENTRAIQRYIVMPAQATAYKVGMLKIQELRQRASEKLGKKYDNRAFHDQVLGQGALPLNILENNIEEWIKTQL